MRLLDRYLLRELLVPLAYCLGGFLIFWVSFDLIGDLQDFQAFKLTAKDVAAYYLVMLPEILVTIAPVALLLALLYALTNHARHQELTAMRAAGTRPDSTRIAAGRMAGYSFRPVVGSTRWGAETPSSPVRFSSAALTASAWFVPSMIRGVTKTRRLFRRVVSLE